MLVRLEVMRRHGRHLIEYFAEIYLDFLFNVDTLFEKENLTHRNVLIAIDEALSLWVLLSEAWNDGLMDLQTDFLLDFTADWLDDFVGEGFVNVFFVVIYSYIGCLKMFDIPKHLHWIVQGHQEVIKLVWPLDVRHDHFKNVWEQ